MIRFRTSGSYARTEEFVRRMASGQIYRSLQGQAQKGVAALSAATPTDGGATAGAWSAEVKKTGAGWEIVWSNTNKPNGFPVAIMLQYGHGTGTGGYVQGRDYINPAIQPVFDQIADAVWREVTRA